MFEKLITALPYNPNLLHQLAFYGKRMRQEQSVRRVGLLFIVLAFFIQFFAVISPPQPTVASSTNDILNGGFSSKAEAVSACHANTQNYSKILAYYGISCTDVANASTTTLTSTAQNNTLFSMGRLPYGARNASSGKVTSETPVQISGVGTVYLRHLSSFDTGPSSSYQALQGVNSTTHKTFYLLYNCGNLVFIGVQGPPIRCQYDSSILASDAKCVKPCLYNSSIPASSAQCFVPCPIAGKSNIPQSSPQCVATCPYNNKLPANSPNCFKPCQYNPAIPSSNTACVPPCQYNPAIPSSSPACVTPCQYNPSLSNTSPDCKPCDKSVSSADTLACVIVSKSASNTTTGTKDANNTMAHAGDTLVYTLYAKNNGKATVKAFVFQENLSDVLDYADVVDLQGGNENTENVVTWSAVDINAGATVSKTLTVRVKTPVPQTPVSSSDGGHFDLTMTNVYGNTVNITLPADVTKTVETAAAVLPNTGPGTSLFGAAAIVVLAGYFFSRARLLATETSIVVQDNNSGGF
ncbi:MAG: hypothetical protein ABI602_04460 [Candidatus Saccharibacteria bacterium]